MEKKNLSFPFFHMLFLSLTVPLYDRMGANHFHGTRQNEKGKSVHLVSPPRLPTHLAPSLKHIFEMVSLRTESNFSLPLEDRVESTGEKGAIRMCLSCVGFGHARVAVTSGL